MHRGYIRLWRKIQDNPLWVSEKFTRGQAWIDLVMLANHKDGHIRIRGIKVPVKRGQCGWSVVSLAARWRWSRGRVNRFLKELETVQQIEQQKSFVTSLINIINYNEYQPNGTANRTASDTANGQQTDTNKNDKNVNKEKIVLPDKSNNHIPYKEIVDYLNLKSKKNFKTENKITRQHIKARWNEGFKADDFKKVIDVKSKQWLTDEKMNPYLRPQTLFNTKFESYLNEYSQINKSFSVNLDDVAREQYAELEKIKREYWGK